MDTSTRLKLGFAALMILSGIGVASYPVISNMVAQRHASTAIQNYDETVHSMDTEKLDAAKEAARRYNEQLGSALDRDTAGEAEDTGTSYVDLIDVGESLGYITIPKIDVNLPIYEGTSDDVLLKGVGHLEGSSYPLGGESTHSVLTGHRGLAEAVLFTDLDKLQEGDKFYLHIMDEVLAYQVDQVKVVLPEETDDLTIVQGQDYCTLVTCTPYAINTHRMLVRGIRVPYNGEEETGDTPQVVQYQAPLAVGAHQPQYGGKSGGLGPAGAAVHCLCSGRHQHDGPVRQFLKGGTGSWEKLYTAKKKRAVPPIRC